MLPTSPESKPAALSHDSTSKDVSLWQFVSWSTTRVTQREPAARSAHRLAAPRRRRAYLSRGSCTGQRPLRWWCCSCRCRSCRGRGCRRCIPWNPGRRTGRCAAACCPDATRRWGPGWDMPSGRGSSWWCSDLGLAVSPGRWALRQGGLRETRAESGSFVSELAWATEFISRCWKAGAPRHDLASTVGNSVTVSIQPRQIPIS